MQGQSPELKTVSLGIMYWPGTKNGKADAVSHKGEYFKEQENPNWEKPLLLLKPCKFLDAAVEWNLLTLIWSASQGDLLTKETAASPEQPGSGSKRPHSVIE